MNIAKLFPTHKVVEINLSTGLRTGHMLAQHVYNAPEDAQYVDNGCFFRVSKAAKDTVVLADDSNAVGPYYLHYTEELFTTGLVDAFKYFALEVEDGKCYPRCIALYAGDAITTDNFDKNGIEDLSTVKFAIVGDDGVAKCLTAIPTSGGYNGPLFQAAKSTLPDGTEAMELVVIDPMYSVAA